MNSPSFHKFLPLVAPGGVVVIGDLVEDTGGCPEGRDLCACAGHQDFH